MWSGRDLNPRASIEKPHRTKGLRFPNISRYGWFRAVCSTEGKLSESEFQGAIGQQEDVKQLSAERELIGFVVLRWSQSRLLNSTYVHVTTWWARQCPSIHQVNGFKV